MSDAESEPYGGTVSDLGEAARATVRVLARKYRPATFSDLIGRKPWCAPSRTHSRRVVSLRPGS